MYLRTIMTTIYKRWNSRWEISYTVLFLMKKCCMRASVDTEMCCPKCGCQYFILSNDNVRILCLSCNVKKVENLSDLSKNDRNKRHSSPFINVVFFVVRVIIVPVSYLSAPSDVHSYRVPGKFIRRSASGRVWRYQRGYQNRYIEEGQTTQWPKENVQKDK
jgi:hypothetical protein